MAEPAIFSLDDHAPASFGLDLPERLMWEAFAVRADVERTGEWQTGRASEVGYMELNLRAIRDDSRPRPVIWQFDEPEPMNPLGLCLAYEEDVGIKPVVSDFDALLVGTQGITYPEQLADEQVVLTKWCIERIEHLLRRGVSRPGWTRAWLEEVRREVAAGFRPQTPKYGFGDPCSNRAIELAVHRLSSTGAMRHGAECFNFIFPQAPDNEYLIAWDGFGNQGARQRRTTLQYVDRRGLKEFLLARIEDGYTFPLNPLWVLCDENWWAIWESLRQVRGMRTWWPLSSGIEELVEKIHGDYPSGWSHDSSPGDSKASSFVNGQGAETVRNMSRSDSARGQCVCSGGATKQSSKSAGDKLTKRRPSDTGSDVGREVVEGPDQLKQRIASSATSTLEVTSDGASDDGDLNVELETAMFKYQTSGFVQRRLSSIMKSQEGAQKATNAAVAWMASIRKWRRRPSVAAIQAPPPPVTTSAPLKRRRSLSSPSVLAMGPAGVKERRPSLASLYGAKGPFAPAAAPASSPRKGSGSSARRHSLFNLKRQETAPPSMLDLANLSASNFAAALAANRLSSAQASCNGPPVTAPLQDVTVIEPAVPVVPACTAAVTQDTPPDSDLPVKQRDDNPQHEPQHVDAPAGAQCCCVLM